MNSFIKTKTVNVTTNENGTFATASTGVNVEKIISMRANSSYYGVFFCGISCRVLSVSSPGGSLLTNTSLDVVVYYID